MQSEFDTYFQGEGVAFNNKFYLIVCFASPKE